MRITTQWTTEVFNLEGLTADNGRLEIRSAIRTTTPNGQVSWSFEGFKLTATGQRRANSFMSSPVYPDNEAAVIAQIEGLIEVQS